MRAVFYDRNGPAREVLTCGEIADPLPAAGEVRVKLATSGVNPTDVKSRAGRTRKIAFPRVVPHHDGAGVIDRVGDGVSQARIGERVWVWNGQWQRPYGTCADYIALPAAMAVPLPPGIGFDVGACLGVPAMTAAHAVAAARIGPASTALVSGGAGAVGFFAIQFAKARGARVITTVSSEAKAALARTAGADHVIDYRQADVGAEVARLTEAGGVDAVIEVDITANARLLPSVLKPRGTVAVYGVGADAPLPLRFLLLSGIDLSFVDVFLLTPAERAAAIDAISVMLARDGLRHNVARICRLDETVAAHEFVESGTAVGKVLIAID